MKSKNSKFLASVCVSSALMVSATYPSITALAAEVVTATKAPEADKITVANNKKTTDDKITVTGLKAGDKVNVYSAATGGTAIGTVTVADGKTEATVTKTDGLVAAGGTVYVSIQSKDELESAR
ncbi:IMP dehydrogenase, partial [Bacillus toyonensis]